MHHDRVAGTAPPDVGQRPLCGKAQPRYPVALLGLHLMSDAIVAANRPAGVWSASSAPGGKAPMLDDGPDRTVRLDRVATDGRRFATHTWDSAVATMTQRWQYSADSANSNPRLLRRARIGADGVGSGVVIA
jgi:hypothetical protein